ncbi:MAG: hypothetical protein VW338_16015 [Rhodospirillaceae bacterium]
MLEAQQATADSVAERIVSHAWVRLAGLVVGVLATALLSLALYVYVGEMAAFRQAIQALTHAVAKATEERAADRLENSRAVGELRLSLTELETFARAGGRYTKEEALADKQRQTELDAKQGELLIKLDEQIDRVNDRLNQHLIDAAAAGRR